ncbi:MAG: hypothetical protein NVS3B10_13490 [Polyangiales bacterium]
MSKALKVPGSAQAPRPAASPKPVVETVLFHVDEALERELDEGLADVAQGHVVDAAEHLATLRKTR